MPHRPADTRDRDGQVTTEDREHVRLIAIDRVEKRNSFTPKMHGELQAALTELDESDRLRAGVVFGKGEHTSAGLDLAAFAPFLRSGRSPLLPEGVDPWGRGRRCRKPIVTAVRGITFTAGLELALAGDIIVAASDCRFAQLEPRRGIMSASGGIIKLIQRAGWGNAMYHLLTCDEFGAAEAYRIGMVQEVVEPGRELARAVEIAALIASHAPLAVQATKAHGLDYLREGEDAANRELRSTQARLARTEDAAEGLRSFVEKRAAHFEGR